MTIDYEPWAFPGIEVEPPEPTDPPLAAHYYAQLDEDGKCVAVTQTAGEIEAEHMIRIGSLDASLIGQTRVADGWTPAPPVADPAEWLIDIGPFFDRFAGAKMAVLSSSNTTVRALVSDLQVRKWVDLKRADVAAGIDALIALSVTGVTPTLKTSILTTPVAPDENLALRVMFFGGVR